MNQQHEGKGFTNNSKSASEAGKKGGKASHSKTTSKQGGSSKTGQKS